MNTLHAQQRGNIAVIALAALIVILLGVIGWKLLSKEDEKPSQTTSKSETSDRAAEVTEQENALPVGGSKLQINARNTQRKNDASQAAGSVAEYVANNSGQMPIGFADGELYGGYGGYAAPVELGYYKTLTVQTGDQPALSEDGLAVVTGATCRPDGEAVNSTSSRNYVVQYMLEETGRTLKPACLDA
jgi:guanyl-specific ribonuclease Sa